MDSHFNVSAAATDFTDSSYWSPTVFAPTPPPIDDGRTADALLTAALLTPFQADHVTYSKRKLRLRASALTPFQRYRLELLSTGRAAEDDLDPADLSDPTQHLDWTDAAQDDDTANQSALLRVVENFTGQYATPQLALETAFTQGRLTAHIAGHNIDPLASGAPVHAAKHASAGRPMAPNVEVRPEAVAREYDPTHAAPPESLFHRQHERDFPLNPVLQGAFSAGYGDQRFPETQFLGVARPLAKTRVQKKSAPSVAPPPATVSQSRPLPPTAGRGFVSLGESITTARLGGGSA